MDMHQIRNGRHLLYLDLLGFKDLVNRCSASDIYHVLDQVLAEFTLRQTRIGHQFKTLYFSDTIIFYQATPQWGSWAFLDCYAIGAMAWSTLASKGIPARGAVSFGEFHVKPSSTGSFEAFWGPALIEAYEVEQDKLHRDWIGISICKSALNAMNYMEEGTIECFAREGRWLDAGDETLFLNPFLKLPGAYVDNLIGEIQGDIGSWNAPDFPAEVRALKFLKSVLDQHYQGVNKMPEQVLNKYTQTYSRYYEMLGPEVVEWATKIGQEIG